MVPIRLRAEKLVWGAGDQKELCDLLVRGIVRYICTVWKIFSSMVVNPPAEIAFELA